MLLLATFATAMISCEPKVVDINYGKDMCHYCSMTIVDRQYSAQYVTGKGRAYKFDAIECLIKDMKAQDEEKMAFIMVSDYSNPGELIDARSARYVVSENIQSPMGENLLAVKDDETAKGIILEAQGDKFEWPQICAKIQDK